MLVSDVIDQVYSEYLYPGGVNRPAFDTVKAGGAGVLAGTGEGTFTTDGRVANIPSDSIIEIDDELIQTSLVTGTAPTVTVTTSGRGYLDSVATSHAVGTRVYIDPDFPRINVFTQIKRLIGELYPAGLYRRVAAPASFTWDTSQWADLPAGTQDVLSVLVRNPGTLVKYTPSLMEGRDYTVQYEFSPPKFNMIRGGFKGAAIQMVTKQDFVVPTTTAEDLTATDFIPTTLQPAMAMCVAGYLLSGREVPRAQIEDIRRQLASQGVQVGVALNIGEHLQQIFWDRYVSNERRRMFEMDPTRFSVRKT